MTLEQPIFIVSQREDREYASVGSQTAGRCTFVRLDPIDPATVNVTQVPRITADGHIELALMDGAEPFQVGRFFRFSSIDVADVEALGRDLVSSRKTPTP